MGNWHNVLRAINMASCMSFPYYTRFHGLTRNQQPSLRNRTPTLLPTTPKMRQVLFLRRLFASQRSTHPHYKPRQKQQRPLPRRKSRDWVRACLYQHDSAFPRLRMPQWGILVPFGLSADSIQQLRSPRRKIIADKSPQVPFLQMKWVCRSHQQRHVSGTTPNGHRDFYFHLTMGGSQHVVGGCNLPRS